MRVLLVAIVCLVTFECINGYRGPFRKMFPTREPSILTADADPGDPLFLTPYLEQGKIEEARRLR
jgi:hypothetical protein